MNTVEIVGVPLDLGQSRRGVDMGPSALRYADLQKRLMETGLEIKDLGNISVPVREHIKAKRALEYAAEIAGVCEQIYNVGCAVIERGSFPLFLGGDHSIAIGTIAAVTDRTPAGVIWIDSHGDFNLPQTSPNGNIHGMPVSIITGTGIADLVNVGRVGAKISTKDIVLVGVRDLDYDEKELLKKSGIKIYTMREIDERGIGEVIKEAINYLSVLGRIHVSLDMDAIDPQVAPGVGTPAQGGITYREAHLAMELIADSSLACSMDIVEINPVLDYKNTTAATAVEMAASLLGKRIL
ncbi:arginase [Chitinispirillales bacterium ANBcel5]|uniref:arginase n=1 Tax=Cellulosispirillum alkaliphilum TaxID=3039283 RepID=UPI002A54CDC1|nr:arginase [Chitinispirillales bacterium ANBcel5]